LPDSKINRSFIRELSSQSYNFLSKIILGHNFSDLQCGFKAIKVDVFNKIAPYIKDNKWFFDTELIFFTNYFGYKIKEMPVDWQENRYDKRKTKVNLIKDSFKFIINLIKLKIKILLMKD
jgi:selenophosphate synthetase-related protein